ncbi:unnamed protein product [Pleuronectes platessa]|uniref:Uncharacterized protein n=1 Tax=Pleuronectes platessa TaxID=8262 RepID=A0A9N7UPA0_PLEPL|nr:unnamed protein product [Pleuronectes platessa]
MWRQRTETRRLSGSEQFALVDRRRQAGASVTVGGLFSPRIRAPLRASLNTATGGGEKERKSVNEGRDSGGNFISQQKKHKLDSTESEVVTLKTQSHLELAVDNNHRKPHRPSNRKPPMHLPVEVGQKF